MNETQPIPEFRAECRICGDFLGAESVPELIGNYLVHAVKLHWDEVQMLHESSYEKIADAKRFGKAMGWG